MLSVAPLGTCPHPEIAQCSPLCPHNHMYGRVYLSVSVSPPPPSLRPRRAGTVACSCLCPQHFAQCLTDGRDSVAQCGRSFTPSGMEKQNGSSASARAARWARQDPGGDGKQPSSATQAVGAGKGELHPPSQPTVQLVPSTAPASTLAELPGTLAGQPSAGPGLGGTGAVASAIRQLRAPFGTGSLTAQLARAAC